MKLFDISQKVIYLANFSENQLETWLFDFFNNRLDDNIYFNVQHEPAYYQLIDIYSAADDLFQRQFNRVIYVLLRSWNSEYHSLAYFCKLLFFVGRFKNISALDYLSQLADQELELDERRCVFKGNYPDRREGLPSFDVLHQIFQTFISCSPLGARPQRTCELFVRFESSGRYAVPCYRALWQSDYRMGVQHFPRMLQIYNNDLILNFQIEIALSRFIDNFRQFFKANFLHILDIINKLRKNKLALLYELLRKNNFKCFYDVDEKINIFDLSDQDSDEYLSFDDHKTIEVLTDFQINQLQDRVKAIPQSIIH